MWVIVLILIEVYNSEYDNDYIIEVVIPSIEKQKRIVSTLTPVDDKIAINQRINNNFDFKKSFSTFVVNSFHGCLFNMRKIILFILFFISISGYAQSHKYLGMESGLSSRKVYSIQKDKIGYMWFLTHEGIDRYDGKEFKHYTLSYEGKELSSLQDLNWLHVDSNGILWEISKRGRIFKYDISHDAFNLAYTLPEENKADDPIPITYSFIDEKDQIWMCSDNIIYLFDTHTQESHAIPNTMGSITSIAQYHPMHFLVGTTEKIFIIKAEDKNLSIIPNEKLSNNSYEVNDLFYDPVSDKLFIGTFQKGIYVYSFKNQEHKKIDTNTADISITRIKPLNSDEILIATDGAGVIKLYVDNYATEPFIVADYNRNNSIGGNVITDIYVDNIGRIWLANYPTGITIWDERYSQHYWYKHAIGYNQSLVNDCVNAVFEDSDGDLWFATNNGISLYETKTDQWKTVFSTFNSTTQNKNHVYFALCEVSPGVMYAGGYSSSIQKINKRNMSATPITFNTANGTQEKQEKHIHSIIKDSQGYIWLGGFSHLRRVHANEKEIVYYPGIDDITSIVEKDDEHLWVGTTKGLFLLEKETRQITKMKTPVESAYIYSLYQAKDNKLYIGTNGSGLIVYDLLKDSYLLFNKTNSALLSNNIYTILSDGRSNIMFSTESGLTRFYPNDNDFHNWTKDQGLKTNDFNSNSGVLRKNDAFVFGGSNGAVEFNKYMQLPREYFSNMIFSEFMLFYQPVYPGAPKSPLKKDINNTEKLNLNYNENIFSLKVSSINYDYPSNILYSWKLEGFYNEWKTPSKDNIIRFTNLSPGEYTLRVRAISNENRRIMEERSMKITIKPPFTRTKWAFILYIILLGFAGSFIVRLLYLKKQRKVSEEKLRFFINTAHDIRTPLTLIKAPLEELKTKEQLSREGLINMSTAIRNVNVLLRMSNNLINFEQTNLYSSELYISEYELNSFMTEIIKSFQSYADAKGINFTYDSSFHYLNVWFDKQKMDSVVRNIISNALKYTLNDGEVHIYAEEKGNHWSIEVKDTGIGIPSKEQKKLFNEHFRGSNVINSKISGSGIGMVLTQRFVKFHKGKIALTSVEGKGTTIKITFAKGYNHYNKVHLASFTPNTNQDEEFDTPTNDITPIISKPQGQRILIVEDNDELRSYLKRTLSEEYIAQTSENGKEALAIIREYKPDLVISDIMMPEMRGDELCAMLKTDIETSHIPVVLLTALNDDKSILKGLQTGADEYVIKPFNIGILKASIANLLSNRAILRNKYASLDLKGVEEESCTNCSTNIDWKFIAEIKEHVEENMEDPTFNIDTLCALMNMSRTSFYNKIKVLTDMAPADYVRLIKLKKAAELLKEGNHTVTEVAEMTGFNDAKYFREVFKKYFDVSPSKYKG